MKITRETLKKIAHLARLDFEEDGEKEMIDSLSEILTWVDMLNEVDTEGVDPLINMSQEINVFREDEAGQPLDHDRGLKTAPDKDDNYFRVPKVIE